MPEYKLDIFKALAAMDKKDGDWLSKQPDDAKKGFAPPVFIKFASTISGDGLAAEYTLNMINERVNKYANDLMTHHPDLLFRLAASCGLGYTSKHEFIKLPGRKNKNNKLFDLLEKFYPEANNLELEIVLDSFTKQSFKEFIEEAGLTKEESKEAIAAYGKYEK